jgi:hypothetical protein
VPHLALVNRNLKLRGHAEDLLNRARRSWRELPGSEEVTGLIHAEESIEGQDQKQSLGSHSSLQPDECSRQRGLVSQIPS